MDKPFKTIDQQIALMESRGVSTDGDTRNVLMREGYYPVVNGYKDPFIDRGRTESEGDDRFIEGTRFSDIYTLFLFDRSLRETTFHYLLRIEALMRTVCSYTFAESHSGTDDYLRQECFATEEEYEAFGLSGYVYNIQKLHKTLFEKARSDKRASIAHYRKCHESVPIWVLSKDLTFGNVEHFFNLMKPEEQKSVCRRVVEATGASGSKLGYFSPKEARKTLDVLVKARNICAHDERMYCTKIGRRKNVDYLEVMRFMARYLSKDEFSRFVNSVLRLTVSSSQKSSVVSHILEEMGFRTQ